MAANQNAAFQSYENVGIDEDERVPDEEAEYQSYENIGLDSDEFVTTTVHQRPVAWGVTPTPLRTVEILNSATAEYQSYEDVRPSTPIDLSSLTYRGSSASALNTLTALPLPTGSFGGDFVVAACATMTVFGAAGPSYIDDTRLTLIPGSHLVYAGYLNDPIPLDAIDVFTDGTGRVTFGAIALGQPVNIKGTEYATSSFTGDGVSTASVTIPTVNSTAGVMVVLLERANGVANPVSVAPGGYTSRLNISSEVCQVKMWTWAGAPTTNPAGTMTAGVLATGAKLHVTVIGLIHD